MAKESNHQINAHIRGILKHEAEVLKGGQGHKEGQGHPAPHHQPVPHAPTSSRPRKHGKLTFDELNIVETFHPMNKDYGHIKIDEPKTPFAETIQDSPAGVDAAQLKSKLAHLEKRKDAQEKVVKEEEISVPETAGFREARKKHYGEYSSVREAKRLIEMEIAEEEEAEKLKASEHH